MNLWVIAIGLIGAVAVGVGMAVLERSRVRRALNGCLSLLKRNREVLDRNMEAVERVVMMNDETELKDMNAEPVMTALGLEPSDRLIYGGAHVSPWHTPNNPDNRGVAVRIVIYGKDENAEKEAFRKLRGKFMARTPSAEETDRLFDEYHGRGRLK